MVHRLKTLQPYFNDVKIGTKDFELRKNDRNYQVGDTLILEEYDDADFTTGYTGEVIRKTVIYILKDCPQYGLQDGYCILGLV
jgi:ASC-1-like (ASCH) protein